jgi:RNA polymerase sigma-70 factor (ECF subfamily)
MRNRVVTAEALSTQRQHLWDLSYRITGSASRAEGIVRECEGTLGERTAVKLAIDALKRRKVPNYIGSWLPSLVETGNAASANHRPARAQGPRYDSVESGTLAFLRALEELDPRERAVFVMVDACGVSVHEVAATLSVTSVVVRGALQNARRKMLPYDVSHVPPTPAIQEQVRDTLREFISRLQKGETVAMEKMLTPDAHLLFDSGGAFVAPAAIVVGATGARLLNRFSEGTGPIRFSFMMLNGLPAALGKAKARPRWASRFVICIELRGHLIREIDVVMATDKLAAIRFDTL